MKIILHPIARDILCTIVIALLSQGIELVREIHQRRRTESLGDPGQQDCPPDGMWE